MANRGIAILSATSVSWAEADVLQVGFHYQGFQDGNESTDANINFTPGMGAGSIKDAIIAQVKAFYNGNHANWDDWDDTPVVGDTITIPQGLL